MNDRNLGRWMLSAAMCATAATACDERPLDPADRLSQEEKGDEDPGDPGGLLAGEELFAPPTPWLDENFNDPVVRGCLNKRPGWSTPPGADCVRLASDGSCPVAAFLNPTPGLEAWADRDVPDQNSGLQDIEFDMKRDSGVTAATAGRVIFHTTVSPGAPEGILFQVYGGTKMRINYGPNAADAKDLVAVMEPNRFYHVRVLLQLPAATMDVYVDGQLAYTGLDGSPTGPLTSISLVGFNTTGAIVVDNLYGAPARGASWVSIDSPAASATVTGASGASVPITVSASADITSVDFYVEGQYLGSAMTPPSFSFPWNADENPLPRPVGGKLMRSGYFYGDGKYGDYRREINSYTTWYHAWARVGYESGDDPPPPADNPLWEARMKTALLEAASQGRRIILSMNLQETTPGRVTPVREVLMLAAPVWDSIDMIEVADDTPWTRRDTEMKIRDLNTEIDHIPLPHKPLSTIFVPGPMSDAINASGLTTVAPEEYLDGPGHTISQVNIDAMRQQITGHVAQAAAAGRTLVMIDQAYTRNFCWGNIDNVRDLQSVTYVAGANDPNTLGLTMFAYGRASGTQQNPELREAHILAGEQMTGRNFTSARRGLRTISVRGHVGNNVVWDRRVVTATGPIVHASLAVPANKAGQTARVIGKPVPASESWSMTGGTITGATNGNAVTYTSGPPGTVMTLSVNESYFGSRIMQQKVLADFNDVPATDALHDFIANITLNGITGGCGGGNYCPGSAITREQMPVFVLLSKEGTGYLPPPATGTVFSDVPASSPYARWIEELARRGVVGGCGTATPPNLPPYCPTAAVTREQMSVFLLKTREGATYNPPPATGGVFSDVPATSAFAKSIEELARRRITGGCGAAVPPALPPYCPTTAVTRGQMAPFLVATFNLAFP